MTLKEEVLKSVSEADDRLLRMIRALVRSYEDTRPSSVPESVYTELDKDRENFLKNKLPSRSWNAFKDSVEKET